MITAILTAAFAYFLEFAMGEGEILHFYREWLDELPEWIAKPLGKCPICLAFWLGTILSICAVGLHFTNPIIGGASAGILLFAIRMEIKTNYAAEEEQEGH